MSRTACPQGIFVTTDVNVYENTDAPLTFSKET